MPQAIKAMRNAFMALGEGRVEMPPRAVTPVPDQDASHLSMPCYIGGAEHVLCVKVVTFFPQNPAKGEPTTQAVILLSDPGTGAPLAVMDAEYITLIRTGAVSALATQLLSREDARALGVFGTGEVGFWQIAAVKEVRSIESVYVCSLDTERAGPFCKRVENELGLDATFLEDGGWLVRQSDVVCLATSSKTPVLHGRDVRPGTHVNGVGSFTPDMCETDTEFVAKARVVVDLLSAARVGAGEIIAAEAEGAFSWSDATELSSLVASPPRQRDGDDITFFKSVGLAVQDAVVAPIVLRRAKELGLGTKFEID